MLQAECCGLTFSDGREFSLGGGDQIPIFCCKSNPLTEPSLLSNDNCTKKLEPSLRHRTVVRVVYIDGTGYCKQKSWGFRGVLGGGRGRGLSIFST